MCFYTMALLSFLVISNWHEASANARFGLKNDNEDNLYFNIKFNNLIKENCISYYSKFIYLD
jgi:hypothetical protein